MSDLPTDTPLVYLTALEHERDALEARVRALEVEKASTARVTADLADERLKRQQAEHDRDAELESLAGVVAERDAYREALCRVVTHAECDHDGMTYQELADMARAALSQSKGQTDEG